MTTEASARPIASPLPADDAFRVFFDLLDAPAALCDLSLVVVAANAPFEALAGVTGLVGQRLTTLVTQPLEVPEDGRSVDVDVVLRSGQTVALTFSRRGQTVACVAKHLSPMLDSLAAAGRALLEQARVESRLLEIGRSVAGATSEEELVAAVARGVKGLFPGRVFCVRIVDPRTCALTSLYAEGRLKDGARDTFHLRRSMVEKTHLDTTLLVKDRVTVTTGELPLLFQGTLRGVSAPLVASGQFFGLVNIEYPPGLSADTVSDERLLIQLANQVAVAVRNAKLIDELTFVRKYLEDLLENANALILVVNRDLRVVVFNQAMEGLTHRKKADVLGSDVESLVPLSERLKMSRAFTSALRGEPVHSLESSFLEGKGHEVRVALSTSAITSQSGEIEGVIAIGQDQTRMRELERRIIQAEKLASLGQLAASVVHEINNPMTAVATYADALLKRAQNNPQADPADVAKFRKIVDNSERVLRFTRDLVSYARPAHDKPEEIDINQVIERAVSFCEHVLVKYEVRLEHELTEVPRFLAVRQNLVQVLVNLITNASHATKAGGVVTLASAVERDVLVVTVRDTGSGIPAELLTHIFEPFFTTKPDGQGTGLGLSIVQSIVENHGGTIAVDSAQGVGTTFTIRLPMVPTKSG